MPPKIRGDAYTVQVRGLRQLLLATDAAGGDIKKNTRKRLRQAAEPVKQDAARLLTARYGTKPIRVGVSVRRTGMVSVEQRRRRTTGQRPNFGTQQMRKGFLPALKANEANTVRLMQRAVDETFREWSRRP